MQLYWYWYSQSQVFVCVFVLFALVSVPPRCFASRFQSRLISASRECTLCCSFCCCSCCLLFFFVLQLPLPWKIALNLKISHVTARCRYVYPNSYHYPTPPTYHHLLVLPLFPPIFLSSVPHVRFVVHHTNTASCTPATSFFSSPSPPFALADPSIFSCTLHIIVSTCRPHLSNGTLPAHIVSISYLSNVCAASGNKARGSRQLQLLLPHLIG